MKANTDFLHEGMKSVMTDLLEKFGVPTEIRT